MKYDKKYFGDPVLSELSHPKRNRNRYKEVLKHRKGGRILDVGCGNGLFLKLALKDFECEGLDISEYAINDIKKRFGNKIKAAVKNLEKESLEKNRYDVVTAFNILEHTKNPPIAVKNIYNSLKKDGVLIGSVPNNFGLIGGAATKFSNFLDKTHCSTFPPKYWYKLFRAAGFRKIIFFGEVSIGGLVNTYVKNRHWKHISFTLVFICRK